MSRVALLDVNVLVALFSERESNAVFFLQEQEMTRFDAVNYISHGIAKVPGQQDTRAVHGADDALVGEEVRLEVLDVQQALGHIVWAPVTRAS